MDDGPHTPPTEQCPLLNQGDTPVLFKKVHSSAHYQNDDLEGGRTVIEELGRYIPMVTFDEFVQFLAPRVSPHFHLDVDATIESLKSGSDPALTSSNQWSSFPEDPNKSTRSEAALFDPMPNIFMKVVAAIIATSRGRLREENCIVDFLQNPNLAPTSAERHNGSKPDGYFVLKRRNKVMSKDGETEYMHWADIAVSCEYKKKDSEDDLDDVRVHQGPGTKLTYHIRTCERFCGACNTSCVTMCVIEHHLA
jgi:hypothetical protein